MERRLSSRGLRIKSHDKFCTPNLRSTCSTCANSANLPISTRRAETFRQHVWIFLNCNLAGEGQLCAKSFAYFTATLIIMNVIADVLNSDPSFPFFKRRSTSFIILECFTCAAFAAEYVLRVWSSVESPFAQGNWLVARLRLMSQPMPVIDLVVIIVFYMDILLTLDVASGLGGKQI